MQMHKPFKKQDRANLDLTMQQEQGADEIRADEEGKTNLAYADGTDGDVLSPEVRFNELFELASQGTKGRNHERRMTDKSSVGSGTRSRGIGMHLRQGPSGAMVMSSNQSTYGSNSKHKSGAQWKHFFNQP